MSHALSTSYGNNNVLYLLSHTGVVVSASFPITTSTWTLTVQPSSGTWEAPWKWPVVAAVVIISFLISMLVFIVIVSLKQQGWMLGEMARVNKALAITTDNLEEEKARMDVMLVRWVSV